MQSFPLTRSRDPHLAELMAQVYGEQCGDFSFVGALRAIGAVLLFVGAVLEVLFGLGLFSS